MNTAHTPLPWKPDTKDDPFYIFGPNEELIAQMRGFSANLPIKANAEFLIRAINAHDALVEALTRAEHLLNATARFIEFNPVGEYSVFYDETDCDGSCLQIDCVTAVEEARAALALAKKEPYDR